MPVDFYDAIIVSNPQRPRHQPTAPTHTRPVVSKREKKARAQNKKRSRAYRTAG